MLDCSLILVGLSLVGMCVAVDTVAAVVAVGLYGKGLHSLHTIGD